ncbi:MAG: hypothetical protein ACR2K2_13570 [Mycobacteriales bacterium]
MTGPFAPEPPDGSDRWSDQDPAPAGTPELPADPGAAPESGAPDQAGQPEPNQPPDGVVEALPVEAPPVEAPPAEALPVETAAPQPPAARLEAPATPDPQDTTGDEAVRDPVATGASESARTADAVPVEDRAMVDADAAAGPVSLVKPARPSGSDAPTAGIPEARLPEIGAETSPAPTESAPTETARTESVRTPTPRADRPPSRRGVLSLVLVGLLTGLMVAGVAFLGLRLRAEAQTETARDEAVAASRDAARLLFSYDHATLDEDFAKGLSVTTGAFRDEYARTTEQVVADVARQYKAVVVADVVESAVVGASPGEVTTLVFLNQATTSTQIQGRQVDQSRVRMRLVESGGRWLVAEVQAL